MSLNHSQSLTLEASVDERRFRQKIFGWFEHASYATLVINNWRRESNSKRPLVRLITRLRSFAPAAIIVPLFLYRTIGLGGRLNQLKPLSVDWSITIALLALSIHACISAITLAIWHTQRILAGFVEQMDEVQQEKPLSNGEDKEYAKARRKMTILFGFAMLVAGYFVVENGIRGGAILAAAASASQSTALYRASAFGSQALWPLDAAIIVYQMFFSVLAVALVYLTSNAQTIETNRLNEELKTQIAANPEVEALDAFARRHCALLSACKRANDAMSGFATPTLVFGLAVHVFAAFPLRSFDDTQLEMQAKILCFLLSIFSLVAFIVCNTQTPAAFVNAVKATKNAMLMERSISTSENTRINAIANGVVARCQHGDFATRIFGSIRVVDCVFELTVMLAGASIEIMNAIRVSNQ